jgi:glycosyltransferase involved in cell wall biosynthesis
MLPAYLVEHDIYLSASTRDGTSLCLLEAMSSGLYPIVSDIKANAAWIKRGDNGLLHKVSDPQSLAECIALFPRKAGQITDVLRRNRELVVGLGDRSTNMRKLEDIYHRLHWTSKHN